jgi:hypothetical protein
VVEAPLSNSVERIAIARTGHHGSANVLSRSHAR